MNRHAEVAVSVCPPGPLHNRREAVHYREREVWERGGLRSVAEVICCKRASGAISLPSIV